MKIIKLQGYPSEGFITPITYLYNWLTLIGKKSEIVHKVAPGTEFDSVDGEIICRKYVPKVAYTLGQPTHEIYLAKDDTLLYSNGDK